MKGKLLREYSNLIVVVVVDDDFYLLQMMNGPPRVKHEGACDEKPHQTAGL